MRVAVITNIVAPYTTPVFERLAATAGCELLVVYETAMEPNRRWTAERDLPYEHALLKSKTLDLSRLASDAYLHVPFRPLTPLRRFAPDVVVAAGAGIWSSPANLAALGGRHRHRWAFVPWWGSFQRPRPTTVRRVAEPWVRAFVRAGQAWIASGTRAANEVVRLGADRRRTVIAPMAARPIDVEAARDTPNKPRRSTFLFVGQLVERKGIPVLVRAFEGLAGGELWIAGDGPLRPQVEEAAARDSRLRYFGHLGERELLALYRDADALVLPSLYEVWGLVVNEAMAFGLPVVVTDQVGAVDDLVEPSVTGLVVTAGSDEELRGALAELAAWSPEQRAFCSRRAHSKLERWSCDTAASGILHACRVAVEAA